MTFVSGEDLHPVQLKMEPFTFWSLCFLEPLLSAIGSRVDVRDSPSNLARVLHIQGAQF